MDPSVSEALFDEEVGKMRQWVRFKDGRWAIVSATFPDLIVELPHPSGLRRRFRLRCDDWNEKPPSVKSVNAAGEELPSEPTGGKWMRLNTGYGLCAEWTREYHAHHTNNPWSSHQEEITLARIVASVAKHYRAARA